LITRREAAQVLVLWKLAGKKVGSISRHVEKAFNHAGRNVPQLLSFWQVSFSREPVSQEVIIRHAVSKPDLGTSGLTAAFVDAGRKKGNGVSGGAIAPFQRVKRTMICKRAMAQLQAEGKVQVSPKA
jgi:hypothetical protein